MRAVAELPLDHVSAPPAAPRQLAAIGLLALVMAVLGALRLTDLRAQEQSLEAQHERGVARTRAAQHHGGQASPSALPATAQWDRLFGALEVCAGPDVSLLAFDPTPEQRLLRLEGEARNLQALLDYMRRVGATPPFVRAELQSHQASEALSYHVRFVLDLSWRESS